MQHVFFQVLVYEFVVFCKNECLEYDKPMAIGSQTGKNDSPWIVVSVEFLTQFNFTDINLLRRLYIFTVNNLYEITRYFTSISLFRV